MGENWNEHTSTLLQVLVSIQSLILVSDPYFNEPGYETMYNSTSGKLQSAQYNEIRRIATIQYGMNDYLLQLLYPVLQTRMKNGVTSVIPASLITSKSNHHGKEFEEVVRAHFQLKKEQILVQVQQWRNEGVTTLAGSNNSNGLSAISGNIFNSTSGNSNNASGISGVITSSSNSTNSNSSNNIQSGNALALKNQIDILQELLSLL